MKYKYFLMTFLLLTIQPLPIYANPHAISKISFTPDTVLHGDKVTITITFTDTTNITSVGSFYCRLTPDYLCHVPSLTLEKNENTFTTSFVVEEEAGQTIGFDIFIRYNDNNTTKITLPGENKLDFGLAIAEPLEHIYYYKIDVGGEGSQNFLDIQFLPLLASLLIIPILKRKFYNTF